MTAPFLAAARPGPTGTAPTFAELHGHREALLRFARRRLLDPSLAEDVVQDVFEAVLTGRASFAGRSALRSWLTGILKHKIVDLVRSRAGWESLADAAEEDDDGPGADRDLACPQPGPDEQAEQRERLRHTLARIAALPAPLRDVVQLRVIEEQETGEVCRRLAISEENLFVRLHRARRQLLA